MGMLKECSLQPDAPEAMLSEAPFSDDFMRAWKAVGVAAAELLVAYSPERCGAALKQSRHGL